MPKTLLIDLVDGSPQLVIRDVPAASPGHGEVRYRVHAVGINRSDILYMQDVHYYERGQLPARIGYEASGIVDAVGPDVTEYRIGDRVSAIPFGDPRYCVAGESAITPARFLAPWIDGFSAEEAAATWMQYMTCYFPLHEIARVAPGDAVLITAASSSAGLGAIQLAKLLGAKVIASTRTEEKREFLLAAGADHVVVTNEGKVSRKLLDLTAGEGVRVIYDAIGGAFMNEYAEAVASRARIFVYGFLGGSPRIDCNIFPLVRKAATIEPYSLINYAADPAAIDRGRRLLSLALRAGALRPVIDRVFPLAEARRAYEYMSSSVQKGKIVLRTDAT